LKNGKDVKQYFRFCHLHFTELEQERFQISVLPVVCDNSI
jgi:hypothetical protein